ncbi:MAG: hypothetical protein WC906_02175 [Parcubacteria group bacterium]
MKKIIRDNGRKGWNTTKNFFKMISGNKKKYIPLIVIFLFVPYGITVGAVLVRDYHKQKERKEESEEEPISVGTSFFISPNML